MGAAPDTLRVLVTLVEARRWPVDAPDPVSMIEHVMEARGYRRRDLAALLGSRPRASEVLDHRRPPTLPTIRALSAEWDLPADTPVRECDPAARPHRRIVPFTPSGRRRSP